MGINTVTWERALIAISDKHFTGQKLVCGKQTEKEERKKGSNWGNIYH